MKEKVQKKAQVGKRPWLRPQLIVVSSKDGGTAEWVLASCKQNVGGAGAYSDNTGCYDDSGCFDCNAIVAS